jgi:hypothetical protein
MRTQARLEAAAAKAEAGTRYARGERRAQFDDPPATQPRLPLRADRARHVAPQWPRGWHYAEINAGIVRLTADDAELAFFVGHEMAHNILGHADWLDKVGPQDSNIRETEIAADRFALRLMKGAGYDPMAAAASGSGGQENNIRPVFRRHPHARQGADPFSGARSRRLEAQ